eukprot:scaffold29215_cov29-Tisochrysis_lutea.AAC.2
MPHFSTPDGLRVRRLCPLVQSRLASAKLPFCLFSALLRKLPLALQDLVSHHQGQARGHTAPRP